MKINGINGSFFRGEDATDNRRFMRGWGTYRYFNGKPQNVNISITGNKEELEKALKIIQSLKLQ